MHKDRLLKLADYITKVHPRHWNFSVIVGKMHNIESVCSMDEDWRLDLGTQVKKSLECISLSPEKAHTCGAAGCAKIGYMPAAFPRSFEWGENRNIVHKHSKHGTDKDWSKVSEFFGIDIDDVMTLFEPTRYTTAGKTTSKQVAKRIRKYVENDGKITYKDSFGITRKTY